MRPAAKMPCVDVGVTALIVDAGPIVAWLRAKPGKTAAPSGG